MGKCLRALAVCGLLLAASRELFAAESAWPQAIMMALPAIPGGPAGDGAARLRAYDLSLDRHAHIVAALTKSLHGLDPDLEPADLLASGGGATLARAIEERAGRAREILGIHADSKRVRSPLETIADADDAQGILDDCPYVDQASLDRLKNILPDLKKKKAAVLRRAEETAQALVEQSRHPSGQEAAGASPATTRRPKRLRRDGNLILGVLEDPANTLNQETVLVEQWKYLSFSMLGDQEDLPEPTIDGKPAAGSKLEFKRVTRPTAEPGGPFRHDYSFLAIGATPAGRYRVDFPGRFSFTVSVLNEPGRKTPESRLQEGLEVVKLVLNEKDEPLSFAPGVPEEIRALLATYLGHSARQWGRYERYLVEDPTLGPLELKARLRELESLWKYCEDVVAGRVRPGTKDAVAAQLLGREFPIHEAYKEYMHSDPGHGKTFVRNFLELAADFRKALAKCIRPRGDQGL